MKKMGITNKVIIVIICLIILLVLSIFIFKLFSKPKIEFGPPYSVIGKIVNIDKSNQKIHTWTLDLNGKNVKVYLEQPVLRVYFIENNELREEVYENIKQDDSVYINWKVYNVTNQNNIRAKVDSVFVANSVDIINENLIRLRTVRSFLNLTVMK